MVASTCLRKMVSLKRHSLLVLQCLHSHWLVLNSILTRKPWIGQEMPWLMPKQSHDRCDFGDAQHIPKHVLVTVT